MLANRKMKDSGIEWIGEIPEDWKVSKIKNYCTSIYAGGTPDTLNPLYWNGDIHWIPSGSCHDEKIYNAPKSITSLGYDNSSTKLIPKNTAVMAMTGATCGNTGYLTFDSCANQSVTAFVSGNNSNSLYLWYLLQASKEHLITFKTGGAQSGVNVEDCKNIFVPIVPISEQQKIADFLDEKCSHIDSVLEKTRASIDEYKQLKQSVITQTVTKGIRPNRPMKDSGNLWFGEIPSDWNMYKTKYLFSIKKDIAGKEGFTILSITQRGVVPKDISKNEGQLADNYSNYQLVAKGDFAMNHMDLLTGWIDISKYYGVTSPDYRVFVLDRKDLCDCNFYLYLMQMCYFNKIFYGLGQGVSNLGRWRLQADKFLNFRLPLPSLEEQQEIVKYLEVKYSEIDKLIEKKEQLVEELEAYKKSLIYEYVTGKKEVI